MATLSKREIDTGLRRLGELAVARGVELDLVVVEGAAMVLGFSAREATKDVDVMVQIDDIARAALAYDAMTVRDLIRHQG